MASDPSWMLSVLPAEMREVLIQILPVADESRVITVIEVLSPANKTRNNPGRDLYLAKQSEILESETHLVEIDLLRQGEHTIALPREILSREGVWDYLVSLHRGGQLWDYQVWPISLRERLPRIEVPLAGEAPDVVLDLQAVFDRCYEAAGYSRRLDYGRDFPVPLSEADAEWTDALLRSEGLRE